MLLINSCIFRSFYSSHFEDVVHQPHVVVVVVRHTHAHVNLSQLSANNGFSEMHFIGSNMRKVVKKFSFQKCRLRSKRFSRDTTIATNTTTRFLNHVKGDEGSYSAKQIWLL